MDCAPTQINLSSLWAEIHGAFHRLWAEGHPMQDLVKILILQKKKWRLKELKMTYN